MKAKQLKQKKEIEEAFGNYSDQIERQDKTEVGAEIRGKDE